MTAIDLKSQLTLLKSLQDIDVSLHVITRQLEAVPLKIEEATVELKASKDIIARKRAEKAEIEKKKRSEELDLEAKNAHLKDREAKLYAIKTNKEYQAAIKEIADAKQFNRDREEAVIALMEKSDRLDKEITQLSGGLADKEKAFNEKEAELKLEEEMLAAERDKKLALRADAEKNVDKKVLSEYRFIQNRFSDAMALAVNGICGGCNKRIPPQVYIEIQKWKELITCPNCHRLLFYEEVVEEDKEK